jgi:hypothetical protein
MRKTLVFLLVTFASSIAFAQQIELGIVGGGLFNTQSNIHTAAAVEGSFAYRMIGIPMASLYFELPIAAGLKTSTGNGVLLSCTNPCTIATSYSSLLFGPGVKLKLAGGLPISPFLTLGAGVAHFNQTGVFSNTPGNRSTNSALLQLGGGLDLKIAPFFSVRGEVRDYYTGSADSGNARQHNVLAGAGIVLRF